MQRVIIVNDDGSTTNGYFASNKDEEKELGGKHKASKFKDNLYFAYLIVGTVAFSIGIYISYKRLKSLQ